MTNRTSARIRRPLAAVALSLMLLLPTAGCTVAEQDELVASMTRFADGFGRGFLYSLASSLLIN